MTKEHTFQDKRLPARQPETEHQAPRESTPHQAPGAAPLSNLHQTIGNRAVQRMLAQREGTDPIELDPETADRIDRERGGGQALDGAVQSQMGEALGYDMNDVRVHDSPEADDLSHQLGAKAFTTGQDVFFREGAYDPHSSEGQELIAHELTHVVQQGTGTVGSDGGPMQVNAPGDAHEVQADHTAKLVTAAHPPTQRQEIPEEEETLQMQEEEEEMLQAQMEEEEMLQMQAEEEEEEMQA